MCFDFCEENDFLKNSNSYIGTQKVTIYKIWYSSFDLAQILPIVQDVLQILITLSIDRLAVLYLYISYKLLCKRTQRHIIWTSRSSMIPMTQAGQFYVGPLALPLVYVYITESWVFSGIHNPRPFAFLVVLGTSFFDFYLLVIVLSTFFDERLLITPLVTSIVSYVSTII